MEGTLNVTPQKLKETAESFSSSGNTVSALTQQMMDMVKAMANTWQGDAATGYINKFTQLQEDINQLNRMIQEHVADLKTMAEGYEKNESSILSDLESLQTDVIS